MPGHMHNIPSGQFETPVKSIIPMPVLTGVGVLPPLADFNAVRAKNDTYENGNPKVRVALYVEDGNHQHAPLYADWQYGFGRVGSFMSTLDGSWDGNGYLTRGSEGAKFILNVVGDLMAPMRSGFPGYTVDFNPPPAAAEEKINYNYATVIRILGTPAKPVVSDGDIITAFVTSPSNGVQEITFEETGINTAQGVFETREAGIYKIEIFKQDQQGRLIKGFEFTEYFAFSYSKEYDTFRNPFDGYFLMEQLAEIGKGSFVPSSAG